VSVKVITEEELAPLLDRLGELEQQVRALAAGGVTAREDLTPKEVAKRHRVKTKLVYDALRLGQLVAEKRPGRGNRAFDWRIKPDDARAWYAAHVLKTDNQ